MDKICFGLFLLIISLGCKDSTKHEKVKTDETKDFTMVTQLLDNIYIEDQKYRKEIKGIMDEFGRQSPEMQAQWVKINKTDSSNLVLVEDVLAKHGWLSREQIGRTANSTLFLVIQHSNQETQEKYLPLMRAAVKEGRAKAQSLALLEDRIALGKGELQIYGSQIGTDHVTGELYVLPMLDPENVNERRLTVGLGPIEDYISTWDLTWDVEAYKEMLKERGK